ncbi:ABC transporter ATP-binding protein [Archangium violaceum]|uniref:peptidase domain-containing ABC transporter n=1 Tax=Archangium violaceum TaxID=83451 RepID=UPI00193BEE02|nr:ABC transporter ATP-binding protein [Archangium violaceum]QRK06301.1 ABC transporter ATP-binding protein [Archangium violaceum]
MYYPNIDSPASGNAPVHSDTRTPEVLEQLLSELAHTAGVEPASNAVRTVLLDASRQCTGSLEDTWSQHLLHAGQSLGLTLTTLRRSPEDVLRQGSSQGPIATVCFTEHGARWVLLAEWAGARVHVRSNLLASGQAWMDRQGLSQLLAPFAAQSLTWVLAEEAEPIHALRASEGTPPKPPSPFVRLRALMHLEAADLHAVVMYAVGVGLFALTTPIAVQSLVNTVAFGALLQPLVVLSILLLGGLVFAGGLRAMQNWVVEILQQRLFIRVVSDLSHRLPRVQVRAFDRAHGPELANRFFDVVSVQKASSTLLLEGLSVVLQAGIGLLMLAFYHPLLLAFDVLLLLALAGIIFGYGHPATAASLKESKAKYAVAAWLQELARHPITFRQRGGSAHAQRRADELAREYLTTRRKHFKYLFRQILGALGLQAVASALLLGLGGWLVINRQLTLGQLVAAELIVTAVVAAISKFGKHLEAWYDLLASMDKLGQLVDLPLEQDTGESVPARSGPAALELHGLEFHYREGAPVLSGASLEVRAGEKVAITGATAGGKSTLVDLLYGLRAPSGGRILLDGTDLRDLSLASLRRDVVIVKAPEIFAGTLVDNVRMGQPELPLSEVRRVLEAVGLGETLARLPEGLHTEISTGGLPLSSGQVALLHLARALVLRPRLLVLDEVLDTLDPQARDHVLQTLMAEDAPWTLLLITRGPELRDRCVRAYELLGGRLCPRHPERHSLVANPS